MSLRTESLTYERWIFVDGAGDGLVDGPGNLLGMPELTVVFGLLAASDSTDQLSAAASVDELIASPTTESVIAR